MMESQGMKEVSRVFGSKEARIAHEQEHLWLPVGVIAGLQTVGVHWGPSTCSMHL